MNTPTSAIDSIRFEYMTGDGRINTYTVAVTLFSNDKFEGYCFERNGKRSFFPEFIQNNEVIRTDNGEILTVDDWLASHGLVLDDVVTLSNMDDFKEYVISEWESDDIAVLSTMCTMSGDSPYGAIGLFKKFKNGNLQKNPLIFLEYRDSQRCYLVSGKCSGRSYSGLNDAANYFHEQATKLIREAA